MRHSGRNIGLITTVLVLFLATSGCRVLMPLPPHSYIRTPRVTHYAPPQVRTARHHYRYFPRTEVYFDTSSNIYFYLSDNIWLFAPILPSHIRIDLNNFITMELGGPKPYIYHRDISKRYPPGLRKAKHRKQREDRRERWDSKKGRQEEQLQRKEQQLEKRESELERRENRLERRKEEQDNRKARSKDIRAKQKENRSEARKRSKVPPPEARKGKKAKKKNGEDKYEYEEDEQEQEKQGRRKAIWK